MKRDRSETALILSNTPNSLVLTSLDIIEALLGLEARLILVSWNEANFADTLRNILSENIIGCKLLLVLWEIPSQDNCTRLDNEDANTVDDETIKKTIRDVKNTAGLNQEAFQTYVLKSPEHSMVEVEIVEKTKVLFQDNYAGLNMEDANTIVGEVKSENYPTISSRCPQPNIVRVKEPISNSLEQQGTAVEDITIGSIEVVDMATMVYMSQEIKGNHNDITDLSKAIAKESEKFIQEVEKKGWVDGVSFKENSDTPEEIVPVVVINSEQSCSLKMEEGKCFLNDNQPQELQKNRELKTIASSEMFVNFWSKHSQPRRPPDFPVFGCCMDGSKINQTFIPLELLNTSRRSRMHACVCNWTGEDNVNCLANIRNKYQPAVIWTQLPDKVNAAISTITLQHLILRDVRSVNAKFNYPVIRTIPTFSDSKYPGSYKGVTNILLTAVDAERKAVMNSSRLNYCRRIWFPDDKDAELYLVNLKPVQKGDTMWRPFLLGQTGMGRVNATAFVQRCLHYWPIEKILLTGIAASFAKPLSTVVSNEPNLGDLIIPMKFADFAMTKVSSKNGHHETTGKNLPPVHIDPQYSNILIQKLKYYKKTAYFKKLKNMAWTTFLLNIKPASNKTGETEVLIDEERLRAACEKRLNGTLCHNDLFEYIVGKANEGLAELIKAKENSELNLQHWWDNLDWEIYWEPLANREMIPAFNQIENSLLKIHSGPDVHVVTGDTVVADKRCKNFILKLVAKNWGLSIKDNVRALEMESYAIAHMAYYWPRSASSPPIKIGVRSEERRVG